MATESLDKVKRNKDKGTWYQRYAKSFMHAVDGLVYTLKHEHNVWIIYVATILVVLFGFLYKIAIMEWIACILCMGLVLTVEMINSAIEAVVDLASPEIHPLAKIAKDVGSAASLVICTTSLIIGGIIFIPKILATLGIM